MSHYLAQRIRIQTLSIRNTTSESCRTDVYDKPKPYKKPLGWLLVWFKLFFIFHFKFLSLLVIKCKASLIFFWAIWNEGAFCTQYLFVSNLCMLGRGFISHCFTIYSSLITAMWGYQLGIKWFYVKLAVFSPLGAISWTHVDFNQRLKL